MKWAEAVEALSAGKKVKRAGWFGYILITRTGLIVFQDERFKVLEDWEPYVQDMQGEDWEVVE